MTDLQIFLALCFWFVATCIISFIVFGIGYNLGWEERQKSMVLPRNVTKALNQRIDMEEQHGRHSAMGPDKQF